MRCATAERTTCLLIMITIDTMQVETQWYVITVTDIPSITTSEVILFYA
jgi:hypothetical protein